MSSTPTHPLVRLAHVVGDFGSPFYAEERQRDVWNEASAFGLQLVLWSALVLGTGAVWLVGAPSVPYVSVALVLIGVVSTLTVAYAEHLGVDLTEGVRVLRWRLLPYGLLVVALAAGMLRAAAPVGTDTLAGMLTGAALGIACAVLGKRRVWRRG